MTKRAPITKHLNSIQNEMLIILRFYLAWKRLIKFDDFHNISRIEFVDKLISIKCIENDLLIRLSKLLDGNKSVHSLKTTINEIHPSHENLEFIKKLMLELSDLFKPHEKRRNEVLAHLKIGEKDKLMPELDFAPIITLMLKIIDLIAKEKIEFFWSDGRFEKFNLRNELSKLV